jgi:four helix bundle protein
MQDFRRQAVWHRAHAFNLEVQRVIRSFPRVGYAELKSQLLRAADSIPSNIVEGCGAATRKELARYLDISIKSAFEVDYRLQFARDDGVLPYGKWRALTEELTQIRKMLFAFRKTVLDADLEEERKARHRRQSTNRRTKPEGKRSKTDD